MPTPTQSQPRAAGEAAHEYAKHVLRCVEVTGNGRGVFYLDDAEGYTIAKFAGPAWDGRDNDARESEFKALKAEIRQRLNSHASLVAEVARLRADKGALVTALKRCERVVSWCKESGMEGAQITSAQNAARAALAQARK